MAVTLLLLVVLGAPVVSSPRWDGSTGAPASAAVWADLDGDGAFDLATADGDGLRVSLSSRGALQLHAGARIAALTASDFEHDGDTDLIVLSSCGKLQFWRNDGAGQFTYQRPRSHASDNPLVLSRTTIEHGGVGGQGTALPTRTSVPAAGLRARPHVFERGAPLAWSSARPPERSSFRPGSPRSPPIS